MAIRLAIADDYGVSRAGIASILRRDPSIQIVAETADGLGTVERCREQRPDVLVLALRRSALAASAVARLLSRDAATGHAPRILILGERVDQLALHIAVDSGAIGYLPLSLTQAELVAAIYQVYAGRRVLPAVAHHEPPALATLGEQERRVLQHVAQGLPNKAIALQQGISVRTVGNHLQHAFHKLGASNRVEAVMRAREYGLLPPE